MAPPCQQQASFGGEDLRFGYQSGAPGPDLLTRSCRVRPFAALINIYVPIPLAATLGCCSNTRKSFGPSASIAYATSVSPPDEAVAWLGRWYQVLDEAAAWQGTQVLGAR